MKPFRLLAAAVALSALAAPCKAQYYEIANQIPQLIRPALSGSFNYRGYVDVSGMGGVGSQRAGFAEISTTQGFQYSNWFFMGVGLGVQGVWTQRADNYNPWDYPGYDGSKGRCSSGCMIPLFTDFRFKIGAETSTAFFIDLRLGASFLVSDDYLEIGDGYLSQNEYFYLKPSIGLRVPLSQDGRKALNFSVSYQLMTSDYWYRYSDNIALSSIGATVGFEW